MSYSLTTRMVFIIFKIDRFCECRFEGFYKNWFEKKAFWFLIDLVIIISHLNITQLIHLYKLWLITCIFECEKKSTKTIYAIFFIKKATSLFKDFFVNDIFIKWYLPAFGVVILSKHNIYLTNLIYRVVLKSKFSLIINTLAFNDTSYHN